MDAMLSGTDFDLDRVKAVRGFMDQYLDVLHGKGFITHDDLKTYKTFYPLFEPFYVYYDAELSSYQRLDQLAKSALDHPVTGEAEYGPSGRATKLPMSEVIVMIDKP